MYSIFARRFCFTSSIIFGKTNIFGVKHCYCISNICKFLLVKWILFHLSFKVMLQRVLAIFGPALHCRNNNNFKKGRVFFTMRYLYQVNSSVKTALFLGSVKRLLRSFSQHLLEWESGTHQSYLTKQNTKGCSEQSTSLVLYLKARQANKR